MRILNFQDESKTDFISASSMKTILVFLSVIGVCALILAGLTSAPFNELFPALAAICICVPLLALYLSRISIASEDRAWLLRLAFIGFLLRVIVGLAIFYGPVNRMFFGDDQIGYDTMPIVLSSYWRLGGSYPAAILGRLSTHIGYYFFVSVQYYVLGVSFLVPRIFNCFAGAILIVYAYRLGRHVFSSKVGKLSAVLVAFFPSLILWSSINMRDVWLALAILAIVWHSLMLRERFSLVSANIILISLIWIQYNRFYLVLVMIVVIASIFLLSRSKHFVRDSLVAVFLMLLILGLYAQAGVGKEATEAADVAKISKFRRGVGSASAGNSGYLSDVDLDNRTNLVWFFPLSLAYFLFSPFPWQISSIRQLITLPEILVWYGCVPFVIMATVRAFRDRLGRQLSLLFPLLIISFAYTLTSANIGAAYRYRSQVMVFYLVFASEGYLQYRSKKRKSVLPVATSVSPLIVGR